MRSTLSVTASALLLGSVMVVAPARADNFGAIGTCSFSDAASGGSCVRLANNRTHAIEFAGLGNTNGVPDIDDALAWVISNRLDPTDMVAYRDDADPLPDVVAMDNSYPGVAAYGWVDCPASNTGTGGSGATRWCRGQYMRFNSHYNPALTTTTAKRWLSCHELGHTVGVRHLVATNSTSCMNVGTPSQLPTTYSAHDLNHINATY